jgi:hypothetical protein
MKKLLVFVLAIVLLGSCNKDKDEILTINIGDTYQGGIVFYLDSNGGGLIAAKTDQGNYEWGCYGTLISGADGIVIGTGNQNTIDIKVGCTEAGIAPDNCTNLTIGEYRDWFLPSKDELNLIWTNLADSDGDGNNNGPSDPNNLGGFASGNYWSSTELDSSFSWAQNFRIGSQDHNIKTNLLYVRAVRAF